MDGIALSFTNDLTRNLMAICLNLIHDMKIIQKKLYKKVQSPTDTSDHDKLLTIIVCTSSGFTFNII